MRWDRLFTELEAQAGDLEMQERDALVAELRDGEWADTSWRSLLGGEVVLEVAGFGRVAGQVVLVNHQIIQVRSERSEHVISTGAVVAVMSTERRSDPPNVVSASLGWGHVFRALRADAEPVRVRTINGSTIDGEIDVIGRAHV